MMGYYSLNMETIKVQNSTGCILSHCCVGLSIVIVVLNVLKHNGMNSVTQLCWTEHCDCCFECFETQWDEFCHPVVLDRAL
jgi:hypothetical protein